MAHFLAKTSQKRSKDPKRSHLLTFANFSPFTRFATPLPPQNRQNASKNGQNRPFARLCSFSATARRCAFLAPIRHTPAPNRTTPAQKHTIAAPKRTTSARVSTRKNTPKKSPNVALSAPLVPPFTSPSSAVGVIRPQNQCVSGRLCRTSSGRRMVGCCCS